MTESAEYLRYLAIARGAIDIGRSLFLTYFGQRSGLDIFSKGERDFATSADLQIEEEIRAFLESETPHVGFVGEERGGVLDSHEFVWVLDPVDGTVNFSFGSPLCGISLALVRSGKPVAAVVELPVLCEQYTAVRGAGAKWNDVAISVPKQLLLSASVVAFGDFSVTADHAAQNLRRIRVQRLLANRALRVRMLGSAAIDLSWLAVGRHQASLTLSNNPWDMAAGALVASESGATVNAENGAEYSTSSSVTIAAAGAVLSREIHLLLRKADAVSKSSSVNFSSQSSY
jgi:myo-inositol-1(or 4)-monophosphatase